MYEEAINHLSTKANNLYAEEWERIEKTKDKPYNYRKLICIEHREFISKIFEQNVSFIQSIVESIYNGDLYLLKNSLSTKNVQHIINTIHKFNLSCPSTFHKMHEGIPNFHRWIGSGGPEHSYCIKHIKHATYMFPWNNDIGGVRKIIMELVLFFLEMARLRKEFFTNQLI